MDDVRAGQLADQAWLKLSARAAMIVFSVVGSIGIPMLVGYFEKMSTTIQATRDAVSQLREEVRIGQAHDQGRFMDHERRLAFTERRLDRLEALPSLRGSYPAMPNPAGTQPQQ